jgi:hypothetical protein
MNVTVWNAPAEETMPRKQYPRGHVVTCPGIECQGSPTEFCHADATRCEYMYWSCGPGVSFFYYCDRHWVTEGPDGSSPRDRAWVAYEGREGK